MELDLSSLRSVRKFAAAWRQRRLPLQCLINNAGVFAMGGARELTPDGYEAHLGTNHLGHFLLTMLLLPGLQQAAEEVSCNASRQCSLPSAARLWRVLWSFAAIRRAWHVRDAALQRYRPAVRQLLAAAYSNTPPRVRSQLPCCCSHLRRRQGARAA